MMCGHAEDSHMAHSSRGNRTEAFQGDVSLRTFSALSSVDDVIEQKPEPKFICHDGIEFLST